MTSVSIQALATVLLGSAAFLWVALKAPDSELRRPLLFMIAFVVLWMAGQVVMETATTDSAVWNGLCLSFAGACGMGPAWLLLAARYTRSTIFERRPALLVGAGVPPALAYLALLTNDGHHLYAYDMGARILQQAPAHWAGPVFWINLGWQLLLVLGGTALYLRSASTSLSLAQRQHTRWIAASTALPVAATVGRYLDWLPYDFNPVPLSVAICVAAIIGIAIRYRLLDSLPMARRDVIDAIADAVILTDADGLIVDLNPAAEALLGAGKKAMRDQPLARALARLTRDEDVAGAERHLEDGLADHEPPAIALRTRKERDLDVQLGHVCGDEGEPTARFAVIRDVTEARRYERLLRESQQRVVVGGLAAGLAHEVNNPLAFVASNLQQVHRAVTFAPEELEGLEKDRAVELSELAEVVGETIEGVERIAEIVGRIIRPGTLSEDDLVRLDLSRVVQDAVRLVDFHGESTVRTWVEPMDALPQIEGCPERLSQALLNLLLNAQQAAGAVSEGSLFIDAAGDRDGVALRLGVRDASGAPFAGTLPTASGDPTSEAELSAAYETVREHGGALESGAEPGVLFVLRLPAAA